MAHKLYEREGPLNAFTTTADTHYKVSYLLLKRDLKG